MIVVLLAPAPADARFAPPREPAPKAHEPTKPRTQAEAYRHIVEQNRRREEARSNALTQLERLAKGPPNRVRFERAQMVLRQLYAMPDRDGGQDRSTARIEAVTLEAGEPATDLTDLYIAGLVHPSRSMHGPRFSNGVAFVNYLPATSAQYQAVFKRNPSAADSEAYAQATREIRELGQAMMASGSAALSSSARILIFVGHNEGGRLRDIRGGSFDIKSTAADCMAALKLCIFVSCDAHPIVSADALGVVGKISAKRAARVARRLVAVATAAPIMLDGTLRNPEALSFDLMRALSEGDNKVTVYLRLIDGNWALLGLIVVDTSCRQDIARCKVN